VKKKICIIFILLIVLSGCSKSSLESFKGNAEFYFNKAQYDAQLSELKEDMINNNYESTSYFRIANASINSAKSAEEEILRFLKDTKSLKCDIGLDEASLFYYNILVYKTHLLADIEDAVSKEYEPDDILSSLKVDYFMNSDILDQTFSYKLRDGSYRVFSLKWNNACIDTNVYTIKELSNEENI
jgi:hypothetical protein